jgi:MCRA family
MQIYDRMDGRSAEGLNEKRAHIFGGRLGLAAAAFLGRLPGAHVTVYDASGTTGGALDAAGAAETGNKPRGHRELNASHERVRYLCSEVPSIHTPGPTVLDETHEVNVRAQGSVEVAPMLAVLCRRATDIVDAVLRRPSGRLPGLDPQVNDEVARSAASCRLSGRPDHEHARVYERGPRPRGSDAGSGPRRPPPLATHVISHLVRALPPRSAAHP